MNAKRHTKNFLTKAGIFWDKNKVTIILMFISFIFFGGGLQKTLNKIREFAKPPDYKELQDNTKQFYEKIKVLTPLVEENARQIKELTNDYKEFKKDYRAFKEKQMSFNGRVDGKLNLSEKTGSSNFRGYHVKTNIDENN